MGNFSKFLEIFGDYYTILKEDADLLLKLLNIDDCPADLLKHLARFLRAELFDYNLVKNSGFDLDSNNDGVADDWSKQGSTSTWSLIKRRHSIAQRIVGAAVNDGIKQSLTLPTTERVIVMVKIRMNTKDGQIYFGSRTNPANRYELFWIDNLGDWQTYLISHIPGAGTEDYGVFQSTSFNTSFDVDDFWVMKASEVNKMKQWIRNCVTVYKKKGTRQALIDVITYLTSWTPTVAESFMTKFMQIYNYPGCDDLNQEPIFDVTINSFGADRSILNTSALWTSDPKTKVGETIVKNPEFEFDRGIGALPDGVPDNWTKVGIPTILRVQGYRGDFAVRITPNAVDTGLDSDTFTLTGGSTYKLDAYVRKIQGAVPVVKVRNNTSASNDIVLTLTDVTDEFLYFSATGAIAGAGSQTCKVVLSGTSGDIFEVDSIGVCKNALNTNFMCWVEPNTFLDTYLNADHSFEIQPLGVIGTWGSGMNWGKFTDGGSNVAECIANGTATHGLNHIKMTWQNGTQFGLRSNVITGLTAGVVYNLVIKYKTTKTNARLEIYQDGGGVLTSEYLPSTSGNWTYKEIQYTHVSGNVYVAFEIFGGVGGDIYELDEFLFVKWHKRERNWVKDVNTGGSIVTLHEKIAGSWTSGKLRGMPLEMRELSSVIDFGSYYYGISVGRTVTVTLGAPTDNARKEMLEQVLKNYLPAGVNLVVQY